MSANSSTIPDYAGMITFNIDEYFLRSLFHYLPELTPAYISIGLFAFMMLVILYQTVRHGGRFMYIIVITAGLEVLAYGTRVQVIKHPTLNMFIVSTLLLLIAPIFFALVDYMVVAMILQQADKPMKLCSRIKVRADHVSKFFLMSDVICFVVQCGGGGMLAINDANVQQAGSSIVLIGLAAQMIFFSAFAMIVHTIAKDEDLKFNQVPALKPVIRGVAFTMLMLFIRNVYRMIEFSFQAKSYDTDAYFITHEWVFYCFETIPLFLALIGYSYFHFGKALDSNPHNGTVHYVLA